MCRQRTRPRRFYYVGRRNVRGSDDQLRRALTNVSNQCRDALQGREMGIGEGGDMVGKDFQDSSQFFSSANRHHGDGADLQLTASCGVDAVILFRVVASQGHAAPDAFPRQSGIAADRYAHGRSNIAGASPAEVLLFRPQSNGCPRSRSDQPGLLRDQSQDRIDIPGRHLFYDFWQIAQRRFGVETGGTFVSRTSRPAERIAVQYGST
jgi:hypothetical protein